MKITSMLLAGAVTVYGAAAMAGFCSEDAGPRGAVHGYLTSMQNHDFSKAYDFVDKNMTDGKPRAKWAAEQKFFYDGGDVNILGIDIQKAQAPKGDPACAKQAIVPDILKSRDKFNDQGTTEFELYTVVRDGGKWKVDSQETLFDQKKIHHWFPGKVIPKFRSQY